MYVHDWVRLQEVSPTPPPNPRVGGRWLESRREFRSLLRQGCHAGHFTIFILPNPPEMAATGREAIRVC